MTTLSRYNEQQYEHMKKIWNCIHIFSKTLNVKDDDTCISYICFFHCLTELLPFIKYKREIFNFIQQYPLESNINNSFEWSYKLHYYISYKFGEQLVSMEKLYNQYENITINEWSDAVWYVLHFISCNLPNVLSDEIKDSFKSFLMCIRFLIPCNKCRDHMEKYLLENQIDTTNNYTIFLWTYNYHKDVDRFSPDGRNSLKFSPEKIFSVMRITDNDINYIFIDN